MSVYFLPRRIRGRRVGLPESANLRAASPRAKRAAPRYSSPKRPKNFLELRRDLVGRGRSVVMRNDADLLLHLYYELGDRLSGGLRFNYGPSVACPTTTPSWSE